MTESAAPTVAFSGGERQMGVERLSTLPTHQHDDETDGFHDEERLPYVPILHDVGGATEADAVAHVEARTTITNLLLRDENVAAYFDRWGEITDLGPRSVRVVNLTETIARAAGLSGRHALYTDETITLEFNVDSEAEEQRIHRLVSDADEAIEAFTSRLGSIGRPLGREATKLVRDDWALPWPWLSLELLQAYITCTCGYVLGRRYRITYWYEPPPSQLERPMPASPVNLTIRFEPRPGETIQMALSRAADEAAYELVKTFESVTGTDHRRRQLPRGRLPDLEQVHRDVTWWYRNRFGGESKRSLAREHNPFAQNPPTKTIRDALHRAEYWLGASGWEWKRR